MNAILLHPARMSVIPLFSVPTLYRLPARTHLGYQIGHQRERERERERERDHVHIIFISVYCYNCSKLLLVTVVNFLLWQIYKFYFITGMHVQEKNSVSTVQYFPHQTPTGARGTCPLWIRGYYCAETRSTLLAVHLQMCCPTLSHSPHCPQVFSLQHTHN